jgi:hypothetical protein
MVTPDAAEEGPHVDDDALPEPLRALMPEWVIGDDAERSDRIERVNLGEAAAEAQMELQERRASGSGTD